MLQDAYRISKPVPQPLELRVEEHLDFCRVALPLPKGFAVYEARYSLTDRTMKLRSRLSGSTLDTDLPYRKAGERWEPTRPRCESFGPNENQGKAFDLLEKYVDELDQDTLDEEERPGVTPSAKTQLAVQKSGNDYCLELALSNGNVSQCNAFSRATPGRIEVIIAVQGKFKPLILAYNRNALGNWRTTNKSCEAYGLPTTIGESSSHYAAFEALNSARKG